MFCRTPITLRLRERDVIARRPRGTRAAFSLVELIVVMGVVVLLTALMMPAMQQLRENAQRVVCMSNMAQLGHAFFMYAADNEDALPPSNALQEGETPQNLMLAREVGGGEQWDGVGLLFREQYCEAPQCFYCPSHHGEHPYEKYADTWYESAPTTPIYTNYHYAGHIEWKKPGARRRSLDQGDRLVLLTDGLRTASDFNHVLGMNSLRGDGSVGWRDDTGEIFKILPRTIDEAPSPAYVGLWDIVQREK